MKVEIGNPSAIEACDMFDEASNSFVYWRSIPGERVTTLILPDGLPIDEAVQTVIVTMEAHMVPDTKPAWVECEDVTLKNYLCEHYGIAKSKRRPASWGGVIGLPATEPKPKQKRGARSAPAAEGQQPALGLTRGEGE